MKGTKFVSPLESLSVFGKGNKEVMKIGAMASLGLQKCAGVVQNQDFRLKNISQMDSLHVKIELTGVIIFYSALASGSLKIFRISGEKR